MQVTTIACFDPGSASPGVASSWARRLVQQVQVQIENIDRAVAACRHLLQYVGERHRLAWRRELRTILAGAQLAAQAVESDAQRVAGLVSLASTVEDHPGTCAQIRDQARRLHSAVVGQWAMLLEWFDRALRRLDRLSSRPRFVEPARAS